MHNRNGNHATAVTRDLQHLPPAVGYVLAYIRRRPENPITWAWRTLLIDQISAEPAWKGQGVGRALVEAAVDEVQAMSWHFNEQAHAFFRALGFQVQVLRFGRPLRQ